MKPSTKSFLGGMVAGSFGTIAGAVIILLVGAHLYSNYVKATIEERISPPPVPESLEASYDWKATPLDGTPQTMENLRGRFVVLTFWTPDCFACTEQLGYLDELAARMSDTPVVFAAVSLGAESESRDAIAMGEITIPVYIMDGDRPDVYKSSTLPSTFVLTPSGKVAFRYVGIARWDDPSAETYLRNLTVTDLLYNSN